MDTFILLKDAVSSSWKEIGKPQHVLVAFSGGADSTALLMALHRFSQENGGIPRIYAHHVNHGLRKNAENDTRFCEMLCSRFSIPFSCSKLSLSGSSENEARTQRYQALFQSASQVNAGAIALAHHLHDQTETMLMRLIRGTADGIKGMHSFSSREDGISLWRPFLSIAPDTLKKALIEVRVSWQEDESNQDPRYLRNLLRHELLPRMRECSPHMDGHFYQTSLTLHEESAFLNSLAEDFLQKHACTLLPCPYLDANAFSVLHPAMKKRVLHAFFIASAHFLESPDHRMYEACSSIRQGETVNLPENCFLLHTGNHIHLVNPAAGCDLSQLRVMPFKKGLSNGIDTQSIPKYVYDCTILRTRQPGDYIVPFGMTGKKSLQDYLTDRKVDRPFRDHLPLLCQGQEVLWVIGVGASEKMRALPQDDANLLLYYPGRLVTNPLPHSSIQDISTKE